MTEREIFAHALQIQAVAERAAFLDWACGADAALRERVNALLAEQANLGSYLEAPAAQFLPPPIAGGAGSEGDTIDRPARIGAGSRIGRYKLMEQIGEGGMGTVWVAEQTEPVKRRVALKLIKPGMDTRQVLSRFEAERQALALMDHPNIAKVFDGGMTDAGRPYFVMEYVKGVPITDYCDHARLPIRERLKLFIPICQAIQHAHQKGVIHRDLKPSNILVCHYDGVPIPKVIDFGLAKAISQPLTEHTLYTAHGLMVGTPLYMSPEQAEFNNLDIDTRTDIYSLGVILYELLTGTTPLEKQQLKDAAYQEILRLIKEVEPPKPSTRLSRVGSAHQSPRPLGEGGQRPGEGAAPSPSLAFIAAQRSLEPAQLSRLIRGDLDWIVMKSLEKERSRRYETANALARDIECHLRDEPVEAGPPSATYQLARFVGKHRGILVTAATIAVLLLLGTMVSTWQAIRATRAQAVASRAAIAERAAKEQAIAATAAEQKARLEAQAAAAAERAAKESALAREAEAKALFDFVDSRIIAAARPKGEQGGLGWNVTLREALSASLPFIDKNFPNQPLVEAKLRLKLGHSFWFLSEYLIAVNQYEKARALFAEHSSPDDVEALACSRLLANCYTNLGRHIEAMKLREEVLTLTEARFGPDHVETTMTKLGVAVSLAGLNRNTEALDLREEIANLASAKLGKTNYWTMMSQKDLAQSYVAVGRYQDALRLCQETVAQFGARFGLDELNLLICQDHMANAYVGLGQHEDALKILTATLRLRKAKFGPDNPHTMRTMEAVTDTLVNMNRSAEAVPIIDELVQRAAAKQFYSSGIIDAMNHRLRHFEKNCDSAGCRATAEMWEQINRTDAASLYTAVRLRAVTAAVLLANDSSQSAAKEANAEADRAMVWLQKTTAAGYKNVAQLEKDKDLDSLRDRDDFKKLLADLNAAQNKAP